MPSSSIAVFSEPEAFESALRLGCYIELLVTGQGRFRAQLVGIALPRLRLLQAKESLARIAIVSVAPGSFLVIFPTEPKHPQTYGGTRLHAGEMMSVTAGERLHMWAVGSCGWGIISISVKELLMYGQAVAGRNFVLPLGACRLRTSRGSIQSLVVLFKAVMRLTEAQPTRPVETEDAVRGLEQEVIRVLVGCFSMGTAQAHEEAQRHSAIMAGLDQLVETYPHEMLRIPGMCAALGISARTLQECCRQHVGVGPSRYCHLRWMRRVRNALIDAHPGRAGVSQIAQHYGFNDRGRFAAAYRKQFGELPSATLRRGAGA